MRCTPALNAMCFAFRYNSCILTREYSSIGLSGDEIENS